MPPSRLKKGQSFLNTVWNVYLQSAKSRGLEFSLSKSELYNIIINPCYLCGKEPDDNLKTGKRVFNGKFLHHGVDRKNNKKGYTLKNSQPCCTECNQFKRHYSLKRIKRIVRSWKKNGNY